MSSVHLLSIFSQLGRVLSWLCMHQILLYSFMLLIYFGPELICFTFKNLALRKLLHFYSLVINIVSVPVLFFQLPLVLAIICLTIVIYRIINNIRVAFGRTNENYKLHTSNRSIVFLLVTQLIVIIFGKQLASISSRTILSLTMFTALVTAFVCLFSSLRTLKKMTVDRDVVNEAKQPTVSICIPARNETEDLAVCLNSLLSSNYQKLEIIVLDDCSQDKTAEVIKDFSQAGVRFIQGQAPAEGWLGKNQAYQVLLEAAQGEYIIFCGVDVRFESSSISSLIATLQSRQKAMLSVLPRQSSGSSYPIFIQPMRYWWEIALPRRLFNRPAVLSTCWVIQRSKLLDLGGFKSVKNSVIPEAHLARELVKDNLYSFIRSSRDLELSSSKSLASQIETAERLRYPQLHKRLELVWLTSMAEIGLLVLPFVIVIVGLFTNLGLAWPLALISSVTLYLTHGLITAAWIRKGLLINTLIFPLSVLYNVILTNVSMIRYEFGKVIWKERNICIPVMEVYPRLPRI